jgi:hypothetical protein
MVFTPAAKVGATTLAALVALAGGLSWLTNFSLRPTGYNFVVKFGDVAGLLPGANVRFMGLSVGRVQRLDPRGRLVDVTVHVHDSSVHLPRNGRYKIMSLGIIGEKALEIFPPKTPEGVEPVEMTDWLAANEAVRGEDPSRLELVMDEVTDAFSSFRKAADPKKFEELFTKTAENLAETTDTVNQLGKQASGLLKGLEGTPQDAAELIRTLNSLAQRATSWNLYPRTNRQDTPKCNRRSGRSRLILRLSGHWMTRTSLWLSLQTAPALIGCGRRSCGAWAQARARGDGPRCRAARPTVYGVSGSRLVMRSSSCTNREQPVVCFPTTRGLRRASCGVLPGQGFPRRCCTMRAPVMARC